MQAQVVDESMFSSIFNSGGNQAPVKEEGSGFTAAEIPGMFYKPKEEKTELSEEETKKVLDENKEGQEAEENKESLFGDEGKEASPEFTSVKSLFEEMVKNNQLLPLEDEKLETPQDIQDLLNANISHQLEELRKQEENAWYESKSPAWRLVAHFSERAKSPAELLPILQSVDTIERASELDPKDADDAEKLIRMALISRNESPDIIEDTISTYKDNNKLTTIAEKYKPQIVKGENEKIAREKAEADARDLENFNMIKQIHEDAIKVLETPFLGKHKMKQEEKAAIYNLIAAPKDESGGYEIFKAIDNLYETKDYEKLRMIALLLHDDKAYNFYSGIEVAANTANGIMRKVKTTQTGSSQDPAEEPGKVTNKISRQGQGGSGFGYFTK